MGKKGSIFRSYHCPMEEGDLILSKDMGLSKMKKQDYKEKHCPIYKKKLNYYHDFFTSYLFRLSLTELIRPSVLLGQIEM